MECRGQDTGCVVFMDSTSQQTRLAMQSKAPRKRSALSRDSIFSRKGRFLAYYETDDEYLREGMIHSLRMALDMWDDKLENAIPVKFQILMTDSLSSDIEFMTKVYYSRINAQKSRVHNLYKQDHLDTNLIDTMFINANVDWNYSRLSDISGGSVNLTTSFLRHIAHILGFGISITSLNGQFGFTVNRCYSDFDDLVINQNGTKLSSIARTASSATIENYLKQTLYAGTNTIYNRLYSTDSCVDLYHTGKYLFYRTAGLMKYPSTPKADPINIDRVLLDKIEAIGWPVASHECEIVPTVLDEAGYGSVYFDHYFTLQGYNGNSSDLTWKYQSFSNVTNDYTTVYTRYGGNLIISRNYNPTKFLFRNIDTDEIGPDLCAQRRVVCIVNNDSTHKEYTFPLFLDVCPALESCNVSNVHYTEGSNYFSFDVTLQHYGTITGSLIVCNEYGPSLTYPIGSSTRTIHVDNAFKYGQTYLDITLHNSYGETVKLVYLDNPDIATSRNSPVSSRQIEAKLNDEVISDTLVAHDGDFLSFALSSTDDDTSIEDMDVSWQLCFPKDEDGEWKKQLEGNISCSFKLEPKLFGRYIAGDVDDLFMWEVDEKTNIVYSKGVVRAELMGKEGEKSVVEYPIRIEVLPMMPKVTIANYWEEEDTAYGVMWPYAEVEVMTKNHKGGYFYTTYTVWPGAVGEPFNENTPMPYRVLVDWGGPGCGYGCIVSNGYGILTSPPVFPSKEMTAVNTLETEGLQIRQHGDILSIDLHRRADEVRIAGISGKQYYTQSNVSNLCTSLPKGIYMVTVTCEGKKQVYKINKK